MATYYVAEGGTAANKAAATSGTYPGGCMSPSVFNAESFSPGDEYKLRSSGGDIRATLTSPSTGSDGSPIIMSMADEDACINGADIVTGWSDEGGNIWSASHTPDVNRGMTNGVSCDGVYGQVKTSYGALTSDLDFYYDGSGTFYIYSTSDPDSRFAIVEIAKRESCIRNWYGEDFLTFNGVIAKNSAGSLCVTQGCDSIIFDGCNFGYAGRSCIWGSKLNTFIVRNSDLHAGGTGGGHCIYLGWEDADSTGILIEKNWLHDNLGGKGVQFNSSGGDGTQIAPIIRHNLITGNAIGIGDLSATGGQYYGNIIANMSQSGISLTNDTDDAEDGGDPTGQEPSRNANVYNNTIYNCAKGIIKYAAYATGMTIKNNIVSECDVLVERDAGTGTMTLDNNRYYHSSGYTARFDWDGTSYNTLAAYQSASSQDAASTVGDPGLTDPSNGDFTLAEGSACIGEGVDLGATYDLGVLPGSTWPDNVLTADRDNY